MRGTRQHAQHLPLEQMREFVAASGSLSFTGADREEIYGFVEGTWQARQYLRLSKKDKGVVRRYLAKISGRSLAQITRLIRRYRQSGSVDTVTQWQVVGCCETITISFLMSAPPTLVPAPNHGNQSDWERHPQPRVTSRRSATVTLILYSLPTAYLRPPAFAGIFLCASWRQEKF